MLPSHDYAVFTDGPITQIGVAHTARGHARPAWQTAARPRAFWSGEQR